MVRSAVNSLSSSERWRIGNNELTALKRQFKSKEVSQETMEERRRTIVDFISGTSNRVNSNGVVVEFFVEKQ